MKFSVKSALFGVVMLACAPVAIAQEARDVHPLLKDDFYLNIGVFFPDKDFKIQVDGEDPGSSIEFDEAFRVGNREATAALDFRWRFGEKWSVWGQYWEVSDSGSAVLEEDYQWEDVVFQAGTGASAGVGLDVARVFLGRSFSEGPQYEFGAGVGLHWMEISAFIEGQVLTNVGDTEFYRGEVSADAPLPNIGAWYFWSFSPNWALTTRVDWLSASIGDYSGGLWNASAGVNWAPFEHFGLGLRWSYFSLDVDIDKSDWRGSADLQQSGPVLTLSTYW